MSTKESGEAGAFSKGDSVEIQNGDHTETGAIEEVHTDTDEVTVRVERPPVNELSYSDDEVEVAKVTVPVGETTLLESSTAT